MNEPEQATPEQAFRELAVSIVDGSEVPPASKYDVLAAAGKTNQDLVHLVETMRQRKTAAASLEQALAGIDHAKEKLVDIARRQAALLEEQKTAPFLGAKYDAEMEAERNLAKQVGESSLRIIEMSQEILATTAMTEPADNPPDHMDWRNAKL